MNIVTNFIRKKTLKKSISDHSIDLKSDNMGPFDIVARDEQDEVVSNQSNGMVSISYILSGSWVLGGATNWISIPKTIVSSDQFWIIVLHGDGTTSYTKAVLLEFLDLGNGNFSLHILRAKYDTAALFSALDGDFHAIQTHFNAYGTSADIEEFGSLDGYGTFNVVMYDNNEILSHQLKKTITTFTRFEDKREPASNKNSAGYIFTEVEHCVKEYRGNNCLDSLINQPLFCCDRKNNLIAGHWSSDLVTCGDRDDDFIYMEFFGSDTIEYTSDNRFIEHESASVAKVELNANPELSDAQMYEETLKAVSFARGTMIQTLNGEKPIQELTQGDLVLTVDRGYQPLREIGKQSFTTQELRDMPHLCPIRITAGALGNGLPQVDLFVSPQHRLLVSSNLSQDVMKNDKKTLIAAKHLVGIDGVHWEFNATSIEFWHLIFPRQEVVFSNGVPSEIRFNGERVQKSQREDTCTEVFSFIPKFAYKGPIHEFQKPGTQVQGRFVKIRRNLARRLINENKNQLSA